MNHVCAILMETAALQGRYPFYDPYYPFQQPSDDYFRQVYGTLADCCDCRIGYGNAHAFRKYPWRGYSGFEGCSGGVSSNFGHPGQVPSHQPRHSTLVCPLTYSLGIPSST
jgi:hypothetical protein